MPKIRDLGISWIPATARPLEIGDGASDPQGPTSYPLCCEPTTYPTEPCEPTTHPYAPECEPTTHPYVPECEPTTQPCQPTTPPDPSSQPETEDGGQSAMPPEAIAELKRQLQQQISTEIRY